MNRFIFWGLWLGFILYAFILAPPNHPDTADLILKLSTGAWEGINPTVVALFNAMGIWPMAYAAVALTDGHGQKQRAWPFVLVSFAVGAFALLPYLALRQPNPNFSGPKSVLLRLVESRWLGAALAAGAIALAAFALLKGDWLDFWQQWQTSRFIHVMSLDFVALWLLFPVLLRDDMARRGMSQPWVVAVVLALPLIGACLYLALRPSIEESPAVEGVGA
ncbi:MULTISPECIES: DUF2834 domain-containing protein [Cyanophyceae]|uniref:DUF2834 domain-containing protein n=1 Tax=Cyanophyceae TaxID=3028117 RepID=UPI0016821533|nr:MULTISPECIES: DUF2834 domain-containing protein [Cyanophyceae]MBD1916688.1 DUF2834 domain-containing protein [Phormidium sp. FACHB-77]MBD2031758.1 DUF2834 domain-containing protein [Phormidium sp. FACHB-322]MBD2050508.1 DUF2834 domain-containing protein [Leptolyngbya sp. FACHB-60]